MGGKKGKKGPPIPGPSIVTVTGSFPITVNSSTPAVTPKKFTLKSFTIGLADALNLVNATSNAIANAKIKKQKGGGKKK